MKLIIPMAGKGSRLRPHTHVTPKPLLPVLGASMVERIVDTFVDVLPRPLDEAIFILGDFPPEVNDQLTGICEKRNIKASFAYQDEALGTAHAVNCAADHLDGECIIVFADTLFFMDPDIDFDADAVCWVKHVEDPSRFGVAVREGDRIVEFVEKPATLISNEALIGIYYIKDGATIGKEITYLMENDVRGHGAEFQLTDALDRMIKSGLIFKTASVTDWLDCGTIPALKETTAFMLAREGAELSTGAAENSIIIPPVYLGEGATVEGSVVGPNVSLEAGASIKNAVVNNSILFANAHVENANLTDSVIGHDAVVEGQGAVLNIGDHATAKV